MQIRSMQISRRWLGVAIVALLTALAAVPGAFAATEDTLLSKINSARSSNGLPALASHWDLVDDAEAHSNRMMEADKLYHNSNLAGVTTGWLALGENVGVGPSANSIHTAFMNSSSHRANIMGDFTHVGVGAVRESDNKVWVTVVFMKAKTSSPTTTVATTTTLAPTTTRAVTPTTTSEVPNPTQPPVATTTTTDAPQATPPVTSAPEATDGDTRPALRTRLEVRRVSHRHAPRPR